MYKLLIVDDKFMTIEGLKKLVNWKKYDIQLVGEAYNGHEGISLAQSCKPDIIITDIKMPGIDGLDMIKKIRDEDPNVNFIILSGYDEFKLAKKAFQYGAIDYLLKPVDFEQLDGVILKAVHKIEQQKGLAKEKLISEAALSKSLLVLKKETLSRLLKGEYESIDSIRAKLDICKITFKEEPYSVLSLKAKENVVDDEDGDIRLNEVISRVLAFVEEIKFGYGLEMEKKSAAIILNAPGLDAEWLRIFAEYLYLKFELDKFSITIGAGEIYKQFYKIKYSYIEAERALQYQYLFKNPIIYYSDVQNHLRRLEKVNYPADLENCILEGIKFSNWDKVENALKDYFNGLRQKKIEISYFKNVMMELLFVLKKELNSINVDLEKVFIDEFEEIHSIQEKDSIDDVWKVVLQFIEKISRFVDNTCKKSNKQVVQEVMQYIDDNYTSSDISVAEIAERVCLTPNYISMLIKQASGEKFIDMVVKKRVEKAKELLYDVTLKSYEIAEKVGYTDPNYFSSTFKKVVGITPAEFRNKFCN